MVVKDKIRKSPRKFSNIQDVKAQKKTVIKAEKSHPNRIAKPFGLKSPRTRPGAFVLAPPRDDNDEPKSPKLKKVPKKTSTKKLVEHTVKVKKEITEEIQSKSEQIRKRKRESSESKEEVFPLVDDEEIAALQTKFKVSYATVKKAIDGVIQFTLNNPKLKQTLFNEQFPLLIQLTTVTIPRKHNHTKIFRIPLKHSIVNNNSEICLIVPDVKGVANKDHEKHLEHYESLLRTAEITNVKTIMTFHEFRTEYDTFEMKSRLATLYDHFLADGRISGKVVGKMGKIFYQKRKIPTPIKMDPTKIKSQVEEALKKTPLYFHGKGDSFSIEFGNNDMKLEELAENVFYILAGIDKHLPGGFANVRALNLYAYRGLSIPIYTSLKNQNSLKTKAVETKSAKNAVGELSTQLNMKVTVTPDGTVRVRKSRGSDDEFEKHEPQSKRRKLFIKRQSKNPAVKGTFKSGKGKPVKKNAISKKGKPKVFVPKVKREGVKIKQERGPGARFKAGKKVFASKAKKPGPPKGKKTTGPYRKPKVNKKQFVK